MVAAPSVSRSAMGGPRPLNLNRDVPQVMALLDLVFRPTLDAEGRQLLNSSMALSNQPQFLLRFNQLTKGVAPGFVWDEERRVVGNISLLTTKAADRFLIANVAVHPDFRRRGIARQLMVHTLDYLRGIGARVVLLQVKQQNHAAQQLYLDLGFAIIGDVTSWQGNPRSLRIPAAAPHIPELRLLRRGDWPAVRHLDESSAPPDLTWPEPLAADAYRSSLRQKLTGLFNGQQAETWIAAAPDGTLLGLGRIDSEVGRPYRLRVRVHPEERGVLERKLLAKLLRRLELQRRRQMKIDHPTADETMNQLLREANFRVRHVLTTMKLDLSTAGGAHAAK